MATLKERNRAFYTEEGMKALVNRLQTFVRIYNKENELFGQSLMMFGFGKVVIKNKDECLFRIMELASLTGVSVAKTEVKEALTDGTSLVTETLEVI